LGLPFVRQLLGVVEDAPVLFGALLNAFLNRLKEFVFNVLPRYAVVRQSEVDIDCVFFLGVLASAGSMSSREQPIAFNI
jgi:hypothetical protein